MAIVISELGKVAQSVNDFLDQCGRTNFEIIGYGNASEGGVTPTIKVSRTYYAGIQNDEQNYYANGYLKGNIEYAFSKARTYAKARDYAEAFNSLLLAKWIHHVEIRTIETIHIPEKMAGSRPNPFAHRSLIWAHRENDTFEITTTAPEGQLFPVALPSELASKITELARQRGITPDQLIIELIGKNLE